jgi:hypothetical protein
VREILTIQKEAEWPCAGRELAMVVGMYNWTSGRCGRCPCCRKKTEIVLDARLNMTAKGWDNVMSRISAVVLAKGRGRVRGVVVERPSSRRS